MSTINSNITYRNNIVDTLYKVCNDFNKNEITVLEQCIYDNNDFSTYKDNIYQLIGDIKHMSKEDIYRSVMKTNKDPWTHMYYTDIKKYMDEHDSFIINPFEIEEGVTKCNKCGSERVYTYSKQVRSSDEPMTTFAKCFKCKSTWSYSG